MNATATKDVHEVLDLGEDGEAWAIKGHVDDETALRSVVVHLWELGLAREALEWSELRVGKTLVRRVNGHWLYPKDLGGDGVWRFAEDSDPWTFVG